MKLLNLKGRIRKKIMSALGAGWVAIGGVAHGAPLNTNLVVNPSFENVNTGQTGPFGSVRILDWLDASGDTDDTFAYAYSQTYGGIVPPPGSGLYHYTGGFNTAADTIDIRQTVDVSTGDTAAAIASGAARYDLSGFFSSYLTQDDYSFVRIRFLDATDVELGRAEDIGGTDFVSMLPTQPGPFGDHRDWGQDFTSGVVPVGTARLSVEIGSSQADVNHDGYVDLVDFRISQSTMEDFFRLEVDTTTGAMSIHAGDQTVSMNSYEILSPSGSLRPASWLPRNLDAQGIDAVDGPDAGTVVGNSVGETWDTFAANTDQLTEAFLYGSSFFGGNSGRSVSLGGGYNPAPSSEEDLRFFYETTGDEILEGQVFYVESPVGDMDADGDVDFDDINEFVLGLNSPSAYEDMFGFPPSGPGDTDGDGDFDFDDIPGFVTILSSGDSSAGLAAVPEPSGLALLGAGAVFVVGWAGCRRRKPRA